MDIKLFWKANGGKICFFAGAAGLFTGGFFAGRASEKVKTILSEAEVQYNAFDKAVAEKVMIPEQNGIPAHEYSAEDATKDKKVVKKDTIKKILKEVAPAALVTAGGITATGYAYGNMTQQITGLTSYAATLEGVIAQNDKLLRKQLGDEKVDALYAGYHKELTATTTEDPETGEKTTTFEEKLIKDLDVPADNVFRFRYGRGCREYSTDRRKNEAIISIVNFELASLLAENKYVTVREVCEALSIPPEEWPDCCDIVGKVFNFNDIPEVNSEKLLTIDPYGDLNSDEFIVTFKTDGIITQKMKEIRKNLRNRNR